MDILPAFDGEQDISGLSTDEYYEEMKAHGKDVKPLDKEAMLEYVQKSGGKVIAKKGATFYAVSATVCQLVGLILAASDSLATVSSMLHGEYGIEDVCLSTLTLVGPNGIQVYYRASDQEEESLVVDIDLKHSENVRRWWPFLRDRRIENYGDITRRFID